MIIFPAIDLYEGKAVRLFKGDYHQMTVYSEQPVQVAKAFEAQGATHLHLVDLEGAKTGKTSNLSTIEAIVKETNLFTELGGGIRSLETVETYLSLGVNRVILGTAAVQNEDLVKAAVKEYGEKIAVGVDLKDGFVAIKGWTEQTQVSWLDFCKKMTEFGVKTIICTDISKDGAMAGTNHSLYEEISMAFPNLQLVASGGVSSLSDVERLANQQVYGAIIGKAYYTGAINLAEAIEVSKC